MNMRGGPYLIHTFSKFCLKLNKYVELDYFVHANKKQFEI